MVWWGWREKKGPITKTLGRGGAKGRRGRPGQRGGLFSLFPGKNPRAKEKQIGKRVRGSKGKKNFQGWAFILLGGEKSRCREMSPWFSTGGNFFLPPRPAKGGRENRRGDSPFVRGRNKQREFLKKSTWGRAIVPRSGPIPKFCCLQNPPSTGGDFYVFFKFPFFCFCWGGAGAGINCQRNKQKQGGKRNWGGSAPTPRMLAPVGGRPPQPLTTSRSQKKKIGPHCPRVGKGGPLRLFSLSGPAQTKVGQGDAWKKKHSNVFVPIERNSRGGGGHVEGSGAGKKSEK